jgi:AcrR family transcriptional regulator
MRQTRRTQVTSGHGVRSQIASRTPIAPPTRTESRQQLRSATTRKALLDAAFCIFVRDGFEASRIEDIAAEAGRSRGAFYVNFANKAEAFLALREQQFLKHEARFQEQLQGQATREEQRQAVEEHVVELVLDKSYILLELEFKLFVIRHPRMLKRAAQKHVEANCEMDELRDLFPKGERGTLIMQQRMLAMEAILEGFALNRAFNSHVMTTEYIERCVSQLARQIMESH